ncbi:hypothetical protein DCCM_2460 [Desulfocucumis palustris]|uniref:Uncharacterized protein n=1 Tax=Desulfocucumis palustris TaxID=1898651 RepID=A0A2L2XAQ7_9FIRM|nr:hypothetical protein [Desulfocucumis palustris]GBF33359.1 hypothetical protein DCCM_2460 [Desulfocucumis palustris]
MAYVTQKMFAKQLEELDAEIAGLEYKEFDFNGYFKKTQSIAAGHRELINYLKRKGEQDAIRAAQLLNLQDYRQWLLAIIKESQASVVKEAATTAVKKSTK